MAARRKRVSEVQDRRAGRARVVALGGAPTPVPAPPTGLLKPSITAWAAFWRSDVAQAVDQASDLPRLRRWIEVVPVAWLCPMTQVMGSFMLARFLGTQLHGSGEQLAARDPEPTWEICVAAGTFALFEHRRKA